MDKEQKNLNQFLKIVWKFLGFLGLSGFVIALVVAFNYINNGAQTQSAANAETQGGAAAQAQSSLAINLGSLGEATINEKFGDDIKACWYYQATYKNLHPYTVLWEETEYKRKRNGEIIYDPYNTDNKIFDLRIRVIADNGIWVANTCIKEKDNSDGKMVVKLVGEESIEHRIEAQFQKNGPYEHIANAVAIYNSTLHFDDKGNITHRRVKKSDTYKCRFPESLFEEIFRSSIPYLCELEYYRNEIEPEYKNDGSINYKNELTISGPIVDSASEIKKLKQKSGKLRENVKAIEFYLKKRMELHDDLVKNGCGTLTIQPDYIANEKTGQLEKPSIIYVCHKKGKKSHVRVMVRR